MRKTMFWIKKPHQSTENLKWKDLLKSKTDGLDYQDPNFGSVKWGETASNKSDIKNYIHLMKFFT